MTRGVTQSVNNLKKPYVWYWAAKVRINLQICKFSLKLFGTFRNSSYLCNVKMNVLTIRVESREGKTSAPLPIWRPLFSGFSFCYNASWIPTGAYHPGQAPVIGFKESEHPKREFGPSDNNNLMLPRKCSFGTGWPCSVLWLQYQCSAMAKRLLGYWNNAWGNWCRQRC